MTLTQSHSELVLKVSSATLILMKITQGNKAEVHKIFEEELLFGF